MDIGTAEEENGDTESNGGGTDEGTEFGGGGTDEGTESEDESGNEGELEE